MTRIAGKGPNYKHGMDGTPEYRAYHEMRRRCYSPHRPGYEHYGGRGVKVCDRWMESFENFYADMGSRPGKGYSLDRINNDGDYTPENCRWATLKEQLNNRRVNHKVTINGVTKNVQQWCEEYDIPDGTFHNRLKLGWKESDLLLPSKHTWNYCKRGHEYTTVNTYIAPQGYRECRECRYITKKARRERLRHRS